MKLLTQDELDETLENHEKWLKNTTGGKRADLSNVVLRSASLRFADLRYANLRYADLSYTDLRGANLRYTDLSYTNLSYTDLSYKNLRGADLQGAQIFIAGALHIIDMETFEVFIGSRHCGLRLGNYLKIGCQEHTLEHWEREVENIAKSANYCSEEIKEYSDKVRALYARVRTNKGE